MIWEITILYSVCPYAYFVLDRGEIDNVAARWGIMYAQCLLEFCDLLLFDQSFCDIWVGYKHFSRSYICVHPFAVLLLVVQKVPEAFVRLSNSPSGIKKTAQLLQL